MDVQIRTQLQEYLSETLEDIKTVNDFCDREPKWTLQRKTEIKRMRGVKRQAERLLGRLKKQELEKELGAVLKSTLEGLKNLHAFLDAVERLAVTSLSVFTNKTILPKGVSSAAVQSMISTARMVSPLLIHFKRNPEAFFLPNLGNVDVLVFQLDKYIHFTQQICRTISENTLGIEGIREEKDESFRLSFLFNENARRFMETYSECRPRMFQFLSDLEEAAVQLDMMKKGSSISAVAGSSVGLAGGVLSIVGLALAPVTAGASLALTLTGVGLGVTSGVNSLVTGITEMTVNKHHGGKANDTFQKFMEDVQKILGCIEEAAGRDDPVVDPDAIATAFEAGKVIARTGTVGGGIDTLVYGASAVRALRSEEVARKAVSLGLQEAQAARNIPKLAADLPDIGQLAKGTPLALSKSARAGLITVNALFIGLDLFFICKEGVSLAKGEQSKASQLIRSRSALWCTEIEAWDKIYDCLCKGKDTYTENLRILDQPLNTVGSRSIKQTLLEYIKTKSV